MDASTTPELLAAGGVELTTFWGHALCLGAREWVDWRIRPGDGGMARIAAAAYASDQVFIIAHPLSAGRSGLHGLCVALRGDDAGQRPVGRNLERAVAWRLAQRGGAGALVRLAQPGAAAGGDRRQRHAWPPRLCRGAGVQRDLRREPDGSRAAQRAAGRSPLSQRRAAARVRGRGRSRRALDDRRHRGAACNVHGALGRLPGRRPNPSDRQRQASSPMAGRRSGRRPRGQQRRPRPTGSSWRFGAATARCLPSQIRSFSRLTQRSRKHATNCTNFTNSVVGDPIFVRIRVIGGYSVRPCVSPISVTCRRSRKATGSTAETSTAARVRHMRQTRQTAAQRGREVGIAARLLLLQPETFDRQRTGRPVELRVEPRARAGRRGGSAACNSPNAAAPRACTPPRRSQTRTASLPGGVR